MGKTSKLGLILILLFLPVWVSAQGVFGRWKTVDDNTGIEKAVVRVYEENGTMHAKIEKVLEKGKEDAVCIKCKGNRKDKPIVGMKIMEGLKRNKENEWKGNTLFDPENATTYRCKVWLNPDNPDKLMVRGYLAFFFRTQTWHRVKE